MMSKHSVERLILYRRVLAEMAASGQRFAYSHELATACGASSAQVRRDLMAVDDTATTPKGYTVADLAAGIDRLLGSFEETRAVLVGAGHLGQTLAGHFRRCRSKIHLVAAFDQDSALHGEVFAGVPVHPVGELTRIVQEKQARVGIIAVPGLSAQTVADALVASGIRGILSFAATPLNVPADVYLETIDVIRSLEMVSYFTRSREISAAEAV